MKYRGKQAHGIVAAIRIPEAIYVLAMQQVQLEDLDFSKFVRRAIRRELVNSGTLAATPAEKGTR